MIEYDTIVHVANKTLETRTGCRCLEVSLLLDPLLNYPQETLGGFSNFDGSFCHLCLTLRFAIVAAGMKYSFQP